MSTATQTRPKSGLKAMRTLVMPECHRTLSFVARDEIERDSHFPHQTPSWLAGSILDGFARAVRNYLDRFAELMNSETDVPDDLDEAITQLKGLLNDGKNINAILHLKLLRVTDVLDRIDQLQTLRRAQKCDPVVPIAEGRAS